MKTNKRMRLLFIVSVGLALAALACNAPAVTAGDEPGVDQTPEPAQAEDAAAPTTEVIIENPTPTEAPVDPASVCPEPTADTLLYVDEGNGFCLLYPASFTLQADPDTPSIHSNVQFVGAVVSEGVMESVSAMLQVNVIAGPGVAAGFPAAEYADQVNGPPDESGTFAREEVTVSGGLTAVMVKNQPGMLPHRTLYVNAHDTLYEIMALPDIGPDGTPVPDVELAWSVMLESLTFFPPTFSGEVLPADQVCPSATADTYLFINRRDGYCVLVPDSFEEDPEYGMGWFVGGPELTGLPMMSRVNTAIGMQGPTTETVGQIADRHIEAVPDRDSVIRTEATVSGYPAVFWDRPQGTVPSRSALIVANGYLYTLVVQPIDPVNYPEAVEPAELVWSTFIDSFAFFEPWQ